MFPVQFLCQHQEAQLEQLNQLARARQVPDQKQQDHEKFTAEKIVSLCGESAVFDRFGDPTHREPD